MSHNLLVALFAPSSDPPAGAELRRLRNGYSFAPVSHAKAVLSIDPGVWFGGTRDEINSGDFAWMPTPDNAQELIAKWRAGRRYLLAGLTDRRDFPQPGPSLREMMSLPSVGFEDLATMQDAGFDVVDWAGVSGVTNVGLTPAEVEAVRGLDVQSTSFGLIGDPGDAARFAAMLDKLAPEHAPFLPVRVRVLKPRASPAEREGPVSRARRIRAT